MIGFLHGHIMSIKEDRLLVEVGGVGYDVTVTKRAIDAMPESVRSGVASTRLHIHMAVSETAIRLFGFTSDEIKTTFLELTSVDGVGPKTAMSVLQAMAPEEYRLVVQTGRTDALVAVNGIGKKTAERIIMELKSKYGPAKSDGAKHIDKEAQCKAALVKMGYRPAQVSQALSAVHGADGMELEELIRRTLAVLATKSPEQRT